MLHGYTQRQANHAPHPIPLKRSDSVTQHGAWAEHVCKPNSGACVLKQNAAHDDAIKWKHFPRYWPLVWGIHRSPVNSPRKGQWRGALMFSLICALNKRLSKQSWSWWFETPSCSSWRHCNMLKCWAYESKISYLLIFKRVYTKQQFCVRCIMTIKLLWSFI